MRDHSVRAHIPQVDLVVEIDGSQHYTEWGCSLESRGIIYSSAYS